MGETIKVTGNQTLVSVSNLMPKGYRERKGFDDSCKHLTERRASTIRTMATKSSGPSILSYATLATFRHPTTCTLSQALTLVLIA